eukprot:5262105-Amphidinium_carterae.1
MRAEEMERIRRQCAKAHQEREKQGLGSDFDPNQPWSKVFKEAARHGTFWTKEVERKVVMITAGVTSKQTLTKDDGELPKRRREEEEEVAGTRKRGRRQATTSKAAAPP